MTSRLVASTTDAGSILPATVSVASGSATACGGIAALWLIGWPLGITFTVAVLPTAMVVMTLMRRTTDLFTRYRQVQGMIASRLADALGGTRTIRAAGTTDQEVRRILAPLPELSAAGYGLWATQRRSVWQAALIAALAEIAVLAVAGIGVADQRISTGSFVAVAGYVAMGLGLLDQIDSVVGIGYAAGGTQRVAELFDTPAAGDRNIGESLGAGAGALALRDVTARIGDGDVVLERLGLQIAPGTMLAIVGRSGAGKTTLAHLLGRLREPDEGEIVLDDVPLSSLSARSLQHAVAYAFERPALLGATVHDAIAYARPGLSREQVELAAEMAQADSFIGRLPAGYDTPLSETPLSGGEAQRLGLARAFAQDARLMVLDDATSSLDMVTEALVSQALTDRLQGSFAISICWCPRATTSRSSARAGSESRRWWTWSAAVRSPPAARCLSAGYRCCVSTRTPCGERSRCFPSKRTCSPARCEKT